MGRPCGVLRPEEDGISQRTWELSLVALRLSIPICAPPLYVTAIAGPNVSPSSPSDACGRFFSGQERGLLVGVRV